MHKRESQIYILAEGGEVIEQRIRTEPERFGAVLGSRPRARIVIEASTDSVRAPAAPCRHRSCRAVAGGGYTIIALDAGGNILDLAPVPATLPQRLRRRFPQ